jgi:hypothetical protein
MAGQRGRDGNGGGGGGGISVHLVLDRPGVGSPAAHLGPRHRLGIVGVGVGVVVAPATALVRTFVDTECGEKTDPGCRVHRVKALEAGEAYE